MVTFNCVGYPSTTGGSFGVSIAGAITKLTTSDSTFPVWSGSVPGTTSSVQYSYVELDSTGSTVKSEAFTRQLTQTTDTRTYNEFFERPTTIFNITRLPYTYLATYPSETKAFNEDQIATLHITGPVDSINFMNSQPNNDTDVRVDFRFITADMIYSQTNISFHTSGESSKDYAKQSYKLKFDSDYKQTFFSRPNIKLRSEATEPTHLREKLYIDMLNSVGVPTAQGCYVRLYINNEGYGLYLMVDDIKKSFIKQTIYGGDGNIIPGSLIQANAPTVDDQADLVYKGSNSTNYDPAVYVSQNLGNNPSSNPLGQLITFMSDLQTFDPVTTPNPVDYWTSRLDLDGFLRNMALEYLMGGYDQYWWSGSNYFIYFNPVLSTTGKWQWVPTDFDGTFGNGPVDDANATYKNYYNFQPDHPLVSKLIINNTAINAQFEQILKEIVSTAFKPEAMNAHIDSLHSMISLDAQWDCSLTRYSPGTNQNYTFEDFNNNLIEPVADMGAGLKPWVESRAKTVAAELGFTIPAGTADRVAPPPRNNNKGKGDSSSPANGKNGKGSSAASFALSLPISGFSFIAMLSSCLILLA
ncbi:hypothetical protein BGZ80_009647 [Entomortierella chlamydospora]|uniref:Coth-domain-containing protein n=1 Tax=Entomortierella chlamydospora TaxID=101097 RepID=A0A9P6T0G9_9FUNG|nr:hypothetical protein BGZ80_009647 [Entomortierella chlamydospora]